MNHQTDIHPIADETQKAGKIRFVWKKDGEEHSFSSAVNRLTGDRLAWFDDDPPTVHSDWNESKRTVARIREDNDEILEVIGDF